MTEERKIYKVRSITYAITKDQVAMFKAMF